MLNSDIENTQNSYNKIKGRNWPDHHIFTDDTKSDEDYLDADGNDIRVRPESTLSSIIEPLLERLDLNDDGYIEYYEFKKNSDKYKDKKEADAPESKVPKTTIVRH